MKSFAFFNGNCTVPGTGLADAAKSTTTLKATITHKSSFSAMSCCGLNNEMPRPGYAAQLNWMDGKGNLGQVELVAGDAMLRQVVIRIDWAPPNSAVKSVESAPLPSWAWAAMFSAGTIITLQTKEENGAKLYEIQLANGGNLFDSGWQPFPYDYPAIVCECVLVGLGNDMGATFSGLDASFQMEFASPDGMQYSVSERAGDHSFFAVGVPAYWRITGENSNADQDNLWPDRWTFTQKGG